MADVLFDLRTHVHVGNFHQAVAEASQLNLSAASADVRAEAALLAAQAQSHLNNASVVHAEHKAASHPLLKAACAYASFHSNRAEQEAAVEVVKALYASAKPGAPGVPTVLAVLHAAMLLHRDDCNGALQLAGSWAEALSKEQAHAGQGVTEALLARQGIEVRSVMVEALLRIHRADLADRVLQDMRALDDDNILTMLAGVSVALALAAQNGGGAATSAGDVSKISEAKSIVQDLTARCGQSIALLNIQGVAALLSGSQTDGEQALVTALSKKSSDADTLSNLSAVASATKPHEAFVKVHAQAAASNADATWNKHYAAAQQRFRDAADAFNAASK